MSRGNHMLAQALGLAKAEAAAAPAEVESVPMDEATFRALYDRTARPLWAYLARVSGDPALADDLLQECYCRLLAAAHPPEEEAHQKNYLFRIATNLLRDHWRQGRKHSSVSLEAVSLIANSHALESVPLRSDVGRALAQLKPRERELLWLAYAEGASHQEIAEFSGMKTASIRPLLFRARKKLLAILGGKL